MADTGVPHFHNDLGVPVIHVGSREFMCIGAKPPFDHPHVFLDMGSDDEIICQYCSTLYRFRADLKAGRAEPAECVWDDRVGVAHGVAA
ncbi:MAG: zinc-finger domain-containing protein [Methylobacterium sp.]|uniref:zinc-finger domain-containing protein n=1 Tax=Methylobacterium sp. TaxID=409 RepID=UPI0025E1CD75|nr:zinc-finger domain-containing protein [Methylobacterium sp.]MBX9932555.1 zinc-finger domain-containing protein [Methylobacterium sp.]